MLCDEELRLELHIALSKITDLELRLREALKRVSDLEDEIEFAREHG